MVNFGSGASITTCSQRCGSGSTPECLPKKLSSSAVDSEVWNGASDHAELVRIYAELFTEHQAVFEGFASVFPLEHLGFLSLGAVELDLSHIS